MQRSPVRKDWVYNEYSYANSGNNLVAGQPGAIAFPLTWSQNNRRLAVFGSPGVAPPATAYESWAGIPEGSRQKVYAVRGYLRLDPATWAVGSELTLGWRLIHMEQAATSQAIVTPAAYSMWANGASATTAQYANMGFLREGRISESALGTAISNRGEWMIPIRWQSQRGVELGNSRALWLWVESVAGSVSTRVSAFVSALCRADA